jgi:hypothetical protein
MILIMSSMLVLSTFGPPLGSPPFYLEHRYVRDIWSIFSEDEPQQI